MGAKLRFFCFCVYVISRRMHTIPKYVIYLRLKAKPLMNKDPKTYPTEEKTCNNHIVGESAAVLEEKETFVLPDDVDYASVVEGILQITPDIEEEIAAAERGETLSMDEFKTMFARWLD